MKILFQLFLFVAFTVVVSGQGPFTPINWGKFPTDFSYDENPFTKHVARVYRHTNETLDFENADIRELWNSIEDEYFVNRHYDGGPPVHFDLDPVGNGTFGVTFKLLYDSENLYFLAKFIDTEGKVNDDDKQIELYYQTKYKERYEPGFQAATGILQQNEQYGRFLELGGCNNVLNLTLSGGYWVETWGSMGQTGNWTSHDVGEIPVRTLKDSEGTLWSLSAFSFSDNMYYLDDEWGDMTDPENRVPFDPALKDTIAFEILSYYDLDNDDNPRVKAWWNSTNNDVFKDNYYAGYLVFDDGYSDPLLPDVPDALLNYCLGEDADSLVAYGTKLKWYTDPESDEYTVTAPIPPTDQTGERRYYVTQTLYEMESDPVEIVVRVYQLSGGLSDFSSTCKEEIQFESLVLNNLKNEALDYLWTSLPSGTTYTDEDPVVSLEAVDGSMRIAWEVSSESGCLARDTIEVQFTPSETPVRFSDATALQESNGYQLSIKAPLGQAIDTVYLYKRNEMSDSVFLASFSGMDFPEITYDVPSYPGEQVTYVVESVDMCGNSYTTPDDWPWGLKQPSVLDTTRINAIIFDLSWNAFGGREPEAYDIYRRIGGGGEEMIGSTVPGVSHFTVFQHKTDTMEFQLETRFGNSGTIPVDYSSARSLVLKLPPSGSDIVIDTIFIYDTIHVHREVIDTIRTYQNMWVTDSLVIDVELDDGVPGINIQQILVYPNPTASHLVIETAGEFRLSGYRLKISDMAARVVYDAVFTDPRIEIQATDFGETGLYILEILDSDGSIAYSGKIILR